MGSDSRINFSSFYLEAKQKVDAQIDLIARFSKVRIEKALRQKGSEFFKYVRTFLGEESVPDDFAEVDGISWAPYTDSYGKRKRRDTGSFKNRFFLYRGTGAFKSRKRKSKNSGVSSKAKANSLTNWFKTTDPYSILPAPQVVYRRTATNIEFTYQLFAGLSRANLKKRMRRSAQGYKIYNPRGVERPLIEPALVLYYRRRVNHAVARAIRGE